MKISLHDAALHRPVSQCINKVTHTVTTPHVIFAFVWQVRSSPTIPELF